MKQKFWVIFEMLIPLILFPQLKPDPYREPHIGGEPVYAQVNKGSRRRQDQMDAGLPHQNVDNAGGADSWV